MECYCTINDRRIQDVFDGVNFQMNSNSYEVGIATPTLTVEEEMFIHASMNGMPNGMVYRISWNTAIRLAILLKTRSPKYLIEEIYIYALFLSHTCTPNARSHVCEGQLTVIATENIEIGDVITVDYQDMYGIHGEGLFTRFGKVTCQCQTCTTRVMDTTEEGNSLHYSKNIPFERLFPSRTKHWHNRMGPVPSTCWAI